MHTGLTAMQFGIEAWKHKRTKMTEEKAKVVAKNLFNSLPRELFCTG